jgi:hypothetical protein
MHELQQNDIEREKKDRVLQEKHIEREKKDRVLQEKREQNDAILLENVKRSQDNYRLLPSPSLLPNTTALPPPRLVESQCFNYLFVCAHCTPTITKKIQELKGLTKTKLIVGTAASPYNLCDRDSAAQQNEYGNKINLAIYGGAVSAFGPIQDLIELLEPQLSAKGIPKKANINPFVIKKFSEKVPPLILHIKSKLGTKFKQEDNELLLTNGDKAVGNISEKIYTSDELNSLKEQLKIPSTNDKNSMDKLKTLVSEIENYNITNELVQKDNIMEPKNHDALIRLLEFYKDVVNIKIENFSDSVFEKNYSEHMKKYSPPEFEKNHWGFYHPDFINEYMNLEIYLTCFGFSSNFAKWVAQTTILETKKEDNKEETSVFGEYSIRWPTKFQPALIGCLGDIYNFVFFVQIINFHNGGLTFIDDLLEEDKASLVCDRVDNLKYRLYIELHENHLNIDKKSWLMTALKMQDKGDMFAIASMKRFIKDHKTYTIKPDFLIEDGELDDLLTNMSLQKLLPGPVKIIRQVPSLDPTSLARVNSAPTNKDQKNLHWANETINYIHRTNRELDPEIELLPDSFNKHIVEKNGGNALIFLKVRHQMFGNKEWELLYKTYLDKKAFVIAEAEARFSVGGRKRKKTKKGKSKKRKSTKRKPIKRIKPTKKRRATKRRR